MLKLQKEWELNFFKKVLKMSKIIVLKPVYVC